MDFSAWFMFAVALWVWFLHGIWSKTSAASLIIGKTIIISVLLSGISIIFILLAASSAYKEPKDDNVAQNNSQSLEKIKDENIKDITKETISNDKISQFFAELEKETGIAFGQVEDVSEIVWTNGGAGGLAL